MNTCLHCGYVWRQLNLAKRSPRCPQCQSRRWDAKYARTRFKWQRKDAKKRTCNKCGDSKPATDKYFAVREGGRLRAWCRTCETEYKKEYARKNRHRWKESALAYERKHRYKHRYGISVEDYEAMAASQNWCCAVCHRRYFKQPRRLCVDHDHKTGAVRGLLCVGCNRGIGYFEDKATRLKDAANYLEVKNGDRRASQNDRGRATRVARTYQTARTEA